MCDACQAKGRNWSLSNGPGRSHLEKAKLYTYLEGKEVSLRLCYLCSIKLFTEGEKNFLIENIKLGSELKQQHGASDFDF